jgi:hypothetical protein
MSLHFPIGSGVVDDERMRLLYKPFGIVLGLVAAFVSRKLFDRLWSLVDEEEPPEPDTERTTWGKVLAAAALEGLVFRVTRAAVERAGAAGFHSLTGSWPGKREPEPEAAE